MKKYMLMLALAALAAGTAFAEEGEDAGSQHPKGKSWNREGGRQAWGQNDMRGGQDRRGEMEPRGGERPGGPLDPATMEQMKAYHKAIKQLGEAARAETDEAKKAELVAQLRAKLGEVADLMQQKWEERLAQAEERLAGLKARIEDSKTNRDQRIDEQVQRILAGERPMHHGGFDRFPTAPGGRPAGGPECGGMPPPPPAGDDDLPPPPLDDEDAPPPPPAE